MSRDGVESAVFPCNVESRDSIRVDKEFVSNPVKGNRDLEIVVKRGLIGETYSVWIAEEDIREIHAIFGEALNG